MGTVAQERRIGLHMRTGRGLDKAVEMIRALQVKTLQIFTGNPSAWRSAPLDPQATASFRRSLEELDVQPAMSYVMYLIILVGPNLKFMKISRDVLAVELVCA